MALIISHVVQQVGRENFMLLLLVRVFMGFLGFRPGIFRMIPVFHLTIMVPPVDSNT